MTLANHPAPVIPQPAPDPEPPPRLLLKRAEAAAVLGIHPDTLTRLRKAGQFPAVRVGRSWRWRRGDLERAPVGTLPQPQRGGAR